MKRFERELSADCRRCAGFCCISLGFERGPAFSFDKPADVACRHLGEDGRCGVYAAREALGLAGCARYDCHGAGQRLTREFALGSSWRRDAALVRRVSELFRTLATVHALLLLLREAARLPLEREKVREHALLVALLEPERERSSDEWLAFDDAGAERSVHAFLRSLRATHASSRRTLLVV